MEIKNKLLETTIDELFDEYSTVTGYSVELLKGISRKREICKARMPLITAIYEIFNLGLKKTGKLFSDRDHSTVMHTKAVVHSEVANGYEDTKHFYNVSLILTQKYYNMYKESIDYLERQKNIKPLLEELINANYRFPKEVQEFIDNWAENPNNQKKEKIPHRKRRQTKIIYRAKNKNCRTHSRRDLHRCR